MLIVDVGGDSGAAKSTSKVVYDRNICAPQIRTAHFITFGREPSTDGSFPDRRKTAGTKKVSLSKTDDSPAGANSVQNCTEPVSQAGSGFTAMSAQYHRNSLIPGSVSSVPLTREHPWPSVPRVTRAVTFITKPTMFVRFFRQAAVGARLIPTRETENM